MSLNKTYDPEQLRAINASGGYYLVLAPPGCGKTDILSERIARAKEQGVDFEDMLCLTFTNRAARGMRDRIRQRVNEDASTVFVGNVHRFCSSFLFSNSLISESTAIIDEEETADILSSLDEHYFVARGGGYDKNKVQLVDNIDAYISQRELGHPATAIYLPREYEVYYEAARDAAFDPDRVDGPYETTVRFALQYRRYKQERGLISFSDILVQAYEALRNDHDRHFKRYRWIQVDEVQDLNALQTAIIDELTDTTADFTAMYLGDEQQAIFSFLGAKLGQLELLKKRCAGHVMTLGTNYRSPDYLLEVFNTYAVKELGVAPTLLPESIHSAERDKWSLILTSNASTDVEEERLDRAVRHYLNYEGERVAVLVPTNAAADRVSEKLAKKGIAHFKISGTDLFKTADFKTFAALFSVAVADFNHLAWSRLLYGIDAFSSGTRARNFLTHLKRRMMSPADLFTSETYVAQFCSTYEQREMVFFDTETTGLNVLEDDIVQIAAFKVRGGERVEGSDFNLLLHTDREIPRKLGIIDNPLIEAYATAPHVSREEGLQRFLDYIGDCPVLGHNVGFDYRILQNNVRRTLHRAVEFETYDSLRLARLVCPGMRMYKLAYLLQELGLEGQNSHLADEDIAATKAVVDYCYHKAVPMLAEQRDFLARPRVQTIKERAAVLAPFFKQLEAAFALPASSAPMDNAATDNVATEEGFGVADVLQATYEALRKAKLVDDMGPKFQTFLRYARSEWDDASTAEHETLFDRLARHTTDMAASLNEGDLVSSGDLIDERVFIMTIFKGKGLEFDNVILLEANDGTYPFFTVNNVLGSPQRYTPEQVSFARQERMEDARKFYVALTRAKKRLCVSYAFKNSYGRVTKLTPFMKHIRQYFYGGNQ